MGSSPAPWHEETRYLSRRELYSTKGEALTRTTNDADGDGLAEKGLVDHLLNAGTTAQMEPTLRNGESAVLFSESITFAEGGTEGKRVPGSFVVSVREIEIIYRVQRSRVL